MRCGRLILSTLKKLYGAVITYLQSLILDDYSRFIIAWDLCGQMSSKDVIPSVEQALLLTDLTENNAPKLISDNERCYISEEIKGFLTGKGIKPKNGKPEHFQTQGKIE